MIDEADVEGDDQRAGLFEVLEGLSIDVAGNRQVADRLHALVVDADDHDARIWLAVAHEVVLGWTETLTRQDPTWVRPQAAFTVDRYADDWGELAWVQVLGTG